MTDVILPRSVVEQTLETVDKLHRHMHDNGEDEAVFMCCREYACIGHRKDCFAVSAITNLRAAIEAAKQEREAEPVAKIDEYGVFRDLRDPLAPPFEPETLFYTTPPVPEWKPIETAPKDGTWFLCFNGNWRGVASYWEPNYEGDPWWVDESTEYIHSPPTHWMPLPAAPKKEGE